MAETFCSVCGHLDEAGVHIQRDCPRYGEREWAAADEAWFGRLLAAAPPLGPKQREDLARLLDLGGGDDGTP
jgi:hypothetical protein